MDKDNSALVFVVGGMLQWALGSFLMALIIKEVSLWFGYELPVTVLHLMWTIIKFSIGVKAVFYRERSDN